MSLRSCLVFCGLVLGLLSTAVSAAAAEPTPAELYRHLDEEAAVERIHLDDQAMNELFQRTVNHPVASFAALRRYDPQGVIGFCFGRAMAAHLLARSLGLCPDSIGKAFIVGDLRSGPDPEWRFHVTAIVRGPGGRWWTIDPINSTPLPLTTWISYCKGRWDEHDRAKVYITSRCVVIPRLAVFPALEDETGAHLIELSFDPTAHDGFVERSGSFSHVYDVDGAAERAFFVLPDEYDFEQVTINDMVFDYNEYFVHLLQQMDGISTRFSTPFTLQSAPCGTAMSEPSGLHSMQLHVLTVN